MFESFGDFLDIHGNEWLYVLVSFAAFLVMVIKRRRNRRRGFYEL